MFLPLAHVLAHAITLVAIDGGAAVGFTADIKNLVPEFGNFRPSAILSVPRVFEKVFNTARQVPTTAARARSSTPRPTRDRLLRSRADRWRGPGPQGQARGLRQTGLQASCAPRSVGSARWPSPVVPARRASRSLLQRRGHPVYEGYGLTETTAAFSVNSPGAVKIGTVGRPLPGNSAIADDGEIMLHGGVVFDGYWKNPTATEAAIEDGWFHTGDIGTIDDEGFLDHRP